VSSPTLLLRAAIVARCSADETLAALLGGSGSIRDEPPPGAEPVYALFGAATVLDWSTSSDRGHEHELSVVVWGSSGSSASALAAAERIADLLDDAPLELTGHRLVGIAVTGLDLGRDEESGLPRAVVRLRATTEVAG
jgi:hypothetical protein